MIRKLLTVLLSAAVSVTCIFGLAACEKEKEQYGLSFAEVKDGGATIGYTVLSAIEKEEKIEIPSEFKGLPVISIEEDAFNGGDWITEVVISDSVKTIGEKAFYGCSALTTVSIGSGLMAAGEYAFGKCENLKRVNIGNLKAWCEVDFANAPANPLYFAEELYVGGVLATDIIIPEDTAKIGDYAFYGCAGITSVKTGGGAASVGEQAFVNCKNLKSVNIGNGVTSVGSEAFADCGKLEEVTLGSKVKTIGSYAFNRCYMLEGIALPSGTESIGEGAFSECYGLKTFDMNDGLKTIGEGAFCGCVALEKFIMPDSVTEIGFGVLTFAENGGFSGGEYLGNNLTELVISNSLTEIPDFAFNGCNVNKVTIGSSVETIRYSAFYSCYNLETIIIPKSVTKVESYAFHRCDRVALVCYTGTAEEWAAIKIGKNGNAALTDFVRFYSEAQPTEEGYFWHYEGGVPVAW